MKNTIKLMIAFVLILMNSEVFSADGHHGKMGDGTTAQEGQMGMMDGNKVHGDSMMNERMMMNQDMMDMMKERAAMMSRCADELEKENPNSAELKRCANMMRRQADMMGSCMKKKGGCKMQMHGEPHHENK